MPASPPNFGDACFVFGVIVMAFFLLSIAVPFEWFWRLLGWS